MRLNGMLELILTRKVACKDICRKTKVSADGFYSAYGNGKKFCSECDCFFLTDRKFCECCKRVLRIKPRDRNSKEKFRLKVQRPRKYPLGKDKNSKLIPLK